MLTVLISDVSDDAKQSVKRTFGLFRATIFQRFANLVISETSLNNLRALLVLAHFSPTSSRALSVRGYITPTSSTALLVLGQLSLTSWRTLLVLQQFSLQVREHFFPRAHCRFKKIFSGGFRMVTWKVQPRNPSLC